MDVVKKIIVIPIVREKTKVSWRREKLFSQAAFSKPVVPKLFCSPF